MEITYDSIIKETLFLLQGQRIKNNLNWAEWNLRKKKRKTVFELSEKKHTAYAFII